MATPKHIGIYDVYTPIFSLLHKIFPHLQNTNFTINKLVHEKRIYLLNICKNEKQKKKLILLEWYIRGTSGVMYGARDEDSSSPIDDDSLAIVGHGALD